MCTSSDEKGIFQIDFIRCKENISFFSVNEWQKAVPRKINTKHWKWIFPALNTRLHTFFTWCSPHQNIRTRAGTAGKSGNEHFHTTRIAWHKIKIELQNSAVFHPFPYFSHIKCFIDWKAKASWRRDGSEKRCKVL